MRNRMIVAIVRELYREFLREMIVRHVEQTDSKRDDLVVDILDLMLGYDSSFLKGGKDA